MSDKQTTRCAASGVHQFGRYALTCCENGSDGNGGRSDADISLLRDLVLRNDLADEKPLQRLLCRVFPNPVRECFSSDEHRAQNPADFVWLIDRVQIHWRYAHTGPKTDVVPSRPENGCRTIRAKVLRRHSIVGNAFFVDIEGQEVLVIDLFGLNPSSSEFVYFHQRVICEVEQPNDVFRTMGVTGGEFQSHPVESPDSEELEGRIPMPEVIRPQELPTDPLVAVPNMLFTSKSRDFDLTGNPPEIESDDGADDVLISVSSTVLPPTTLAHCDCGRECKGGRCKHDAPFVIQTGSPEPTLDKPKMEEKSPVGFGNGYGPYRGDGGVPFDP